MKIRPAKTKSEIDFIISYWLDFYRKSSKFARELAPSVYFKEHKGRASTAIKSGVALVLYDPQDPDFLIGFIVGVNAAHLGMDILHMVFIKEPFRGHGLGQKLMKEFSSGGTKLIITHQGNILGLRNSYKELVYNPYYFFKLPLDNNR